MSGTKVSLLNYQYLVCTTTSLNGLLAFFLTDQLQLGTMVSPPNLILSTLVYLRAVLFILFINDLLSSTSSSIYSFADDTYLSSSFSSNSPNLPHSNVSSYHNTSASLLTNDLSTIEMWGNDNRVKSNHGKTTQVVISCKHH